MRIRLGFVMRLDRTADDFGRFSGTLTAAPVCSEGMDRDPLTAGNGDFAGEDPGTLLLAHRGVLERLAREIVGEDTLAEDVVQTTFLRALQRRIDPRQLGTGAWLRTVVQRTALNWSRDRRRALARESEVRPTTPEPAEHAPSPEAIAAREAARRAVVDAVLALEEPHRTVILLRYFEHLTPTQIAGRLRVPASTIRSRLQRAHGELRARLSDGRGESRHALAVLLLPLLEAPVHAGRSSTWTVWSLLVTQKHLFAGAVVALLVAASILGLRLASREGSPPGRPRIDVAAAGPQRTSVGATREVVSAGPSRSVAASTVGSERVDVEDEVPAGFAAGLVGFRGRLVDAGSGLPLAARRVDVLRVPPTVTESIGRGAWPRLTSFGAPAHTDVDGRFEVRGVQPSGLAALRVLRPKRGSAPRSAARLRVGDAEQEALRMVAARPAPGTVADLGDIVIGADAMRFRGRVVDAAEQPVAGALVTAVDTSSSLAGPLADLMDPELRVVLGPDGPADPVWNAPSRLEALRASLGIPSARTDASGHFELLLAAGDYAAPAFEVRAAGFAPQQVVTPDDPADLQQIVLTHGATVRGNVVDAAGQPVAAARVSVAAVAGSLPLHAARVAGETDSRGSFVVHGLPSGPGVTGRVRVAVRRGRESRWVVTQPFRTGEPQRIELPVACPVILEFEGELDALPTCEVSVGSGPLAARRRALGAETRIELPQLRFGETRREVVLGSLDAGVSYSARITVSGRSPARLTFAVAGPTRVRVRGADLPVAGQLVARVVSATGEAVAGARVVPTSGGVISPGCTAAFTDTSGRVRFDDLEHPVDLLLADHPVHGSCRTELRPGRRVGDVELRFVAPGRIEGQLRESGRLPADADGWSVLLHREDSGGLLPTVTPVRAEDGSFEFAALAPGRYRLSAVQGLELRLSPTRIGALVSRRWDGESGVEATVTVRSTQVARPVLDVAAASGQGASGRLFGQLMIDGALVTGRKLALDSRDGGTPTVATTDSAGRFVFEVVDPGKRFLYAFDLESSCFADNQPHLLWSGHVDVAAGEDRELNLQLEMAALSGRVLDASGEPVAGALVVARGVLATPGESPEQPIRSQSAQLTGRDGAFDFTGLAAGSWTLAVRTRGRSSPAGTRLEAIELAAGERRVGVELRQP